MNHVTSISRFETLSALLLLAQVQLVAGCCPEMCERACTESACLGTIPDCRFFNPDNATSTGSEGSCEWQLEFMPGGYNPTEFCLDDKDAQREPAGRCVCMTGSSFDPTMVTVYYSIPLLIVFGALCVFCYCNRKINQNRTTVLEALGPWETPNPGGDPKKVPFVLQVVGETIPAAVLQTFEKNQAAGPPQHTRSSPMPRGGSSFRTRSTPSYNEGFSE